MTLSLGSVLFDGFEVPNVINFGGSQSLAVHQLSDGSRIVDTLGPNNADISWQGTLTGRDATARSRALDAMRIDGSIVPLAWDEFVYSVIISELRCLFHNSWWIGYQIRCFVLDDPAIETLPVAASLLSSVTSDLNISAEYTNVSGAAAAVALAGTTLRGTEAYANASTALLAARQDVDVSIAENSAALTTDDVEAASVAAGGLAAATAARGYIERACLNYSQVGY